MLSIRTMHDSDIIILTKKMQGQKRFMKQMIVNLRKLVWMN